MNAEYISVLVPVATFLGTIAVVVLGFLFNNSRVSDLRSDFSARFDALSGSFNTRFSDLKDVMQANSDKQDANLRRVEDMLLGKFAELDNRLNRIEI